MLHNIALCVIKIEIDLPVKKDLEETGASSTEYSVNPRVQKERERERGLRNSTKIIIETYTNKFWSTNVKNCTNNMNSCEGLLDSQAVINKKSSKHEIPTSSLGNLRETTPLDKTDGISGGQCSSELPKEINFFSGNPSVEVTNGIIHLYKKNEQRDIKEAPSNQLCLLAVPASLSCHDLLSFVAPCHSEIQHIRIVRDGCPNQFMVLLEFRSNLAALEFYQTYNAIPYNSLEPDSICHAVWVSKVERGSDGTPPAGHTELPICPVCLERMDESVDGVLTILCNHAFHANCLVKWGDSTCPVCRHVQTPEFLENSVCMECEGTDSLWICLICGHVGCGRYQGGHAATHYRTTNHTFALQLGTSRVWDYAGDNFVHRLFQNKTDGKLVASNQASNNDGEEKIDSMQLEFTYLLTSQLDTQRKYYEERMDRLEKEWCELRYATESAKEIIASLEQRIQTITKEKHTFEKKLQQNNNKIKELQKNLTEEQEISKSLQTNHSLFLNKHKVLEQEYNNYKETKEKELKEVKEQLHDIMFYMHAQTKIAESDLKDEITGGTVVVPENQPSTSTHKMQRRKKKR